MLDHLVSRWWLLALRGVVAVLFGILAIAWPGVTITALAYLFGFYALVDGLVSIASAFMPDRRTGARRLWQNLTGAGRVSGFERLWLVLVGIAGIAAGIIAFVWPGRTALVLLYLIAFWAIFIGVMQILAAVRLRREIDNEWWLIVGGAAAVVFGVIAFVDPGTGALSLVWLIAVYAILFGVTLLALALRLRGGRGRLPRPV
jgi:uncharacterized membrane protein HdeD (DUF308 family)